MRRLRLVESPRSEEVRAYQARVKAIVEDSQKALEGHDLDRARQLVADMQTFLLGKLTVANTKDTDAGRWDAFRLKGMKAALEHTIEKYGKDFATHLGTATETGYRAGVERTDRVLDVAGAPIGLPGISPHEIVIASKYSPDLIRGYDSYAKQIIGDTITKFVRSGRGFTELMSELKGTIDTRGTPFHSVAYRAELITRTEMQRIAEIGSQSRAKQFNDDNPEFQAKQGMLLQGNGRANSPCDECREIYDSAPYPGGLWDIGDPDFPDLPVHPNCLCCSIVHIPHNLTRESVQRRLWAVVKQIREAKVVREAGGEGWDSSKHPRGEHGKFGSGGGGKKDTELAEPSDDELQSYKDRGVDFQSKASLEPHPGLKVSVTGFNDANGEFRVIGNHLAALPKEDLEGLNGVHVTKFLKDSNGKPVNGLYTIGGKLIQLGRQNRDFSEHATGETAAQAGHTIRHEVGHHWFEKISDQGQEDVLRIGSAMKWSMGKAFSGSDKQKDWAAEAYAMFHEAPWALEGRHQKLYDLIKSNSGVNR